MFNVKYIVWSALILILQGGCTDPQPKPDLPTPPMGKNVGIGLEKGEVEKYPTSPQGLYYYGQVLIEPKLSTQALKGPEAQTFFDHVSSLLGEKRKNFGLSATPIVNGHPLPDIVLFNYSYDSRTKEWVTYLNEEPRTRMVLLKADTTLSFELKYISIDGTKFEEIKNITKEIYGASLFLSGTSIPYIDLVTNKVSNILSHSVSSSTTLYFRPVSDAKKSMNYIVKTKSNQTLAEVKFSLLLRDSVVSGAVVNENFNKIPQVNNFSNPLNAIYTNINDSFTLNDKLQKDESISSFMQTNDPTQFRDKCKNILNRLETYGLNLFDRYNAFSQILEGTNFLQKDSLFHSGCLSKKRLQLLNNMGIAFTAPTPPAQPHMEISDENLKNFGRYMLNPIANVGFRSDLLKMFSETIIVQSDELMNFDGFRSEEGEAVMSPEAFMKELGKIGVARFGKYNGNTARKEFAQFLFRPLNSHVIYRIKFNRERTWGHIRTVLIEAWTDDDISVRKQRELRVAAVSTVLGYENDVMRQEKKVSIALKY